MPARHAGRAAPARGAAPIDLTDVRFARRGDFAAGGCA